MVFLPNFFERKREVEFLFMSTRSPFGTMGRRYKNSTITSGGAVSLWAALAALCVVPPLRVEQNIAGQRKTCRAVGMMIVFDCA